MFRPNVEVTIRREDAGTGEETSEFTAPALMLESEEGDFKYGGGMPGVRLRRELLIPPPRLPRAGDQAVYRNAVWRIRSVRICRGVDGAVVAARCLVED